MTTAGIPMRDALRACVRAIDEFGEPEEPTSTGWVNLRTAQELARQAIELSVDSNAELLAACRTAKALYDDLSLTPLEGVIKYGEDYVPPTDEDCLAVRARLNSALAGY